MQRLCMKLFFAYPVFFCYLCELRINERTFFLRLVDIILNNNKIYKI